MIMNERNEFLAAGDVYKIRISKAPKKEHNIIQHDLYMSAYFDSPMMRCAT